MGKAVHSNQKFQSHGFRLGYLLLIAWLYLLTSCTQEHLIYVRNINKNLPLISLDQILTESGLKPKKPDSKKSQMDAGSKKQSYLETSVSKIPEYNKEMQIAEDQDFSINLTEDKSFVVLKSVQGDVVYLKDKSEQDKGLFVFHSGKTDSKVLLQVYNVNGDLVKNVNYFIRMKAAQKKAVQESPKIQAGNITAQQANTNTAAETAAVQTVNSNENVSSIVITAIQGLSPTEAANELKKMLASSDISDEDRDAIRYKLMDILIGQKSLAQAQKELEQVNVPAKKALYQGRILRMKKNNNEALKNYLSALSGDDLTKRSAISEIESLLLDMGTVEKSVVERLQNETKQYSGDKDYYAESMIQIGRIYEYLPDIYSAKAIFESIINGSFSEVSKAKARKYYNELKKDFLEYK
jgi:tetratricopeptide (TPR) repeat protein